MMGQILQYLMEIREIQAKMLLDPKILFPPVLLSILVELVLGLGLKMMMEIGPYRIQQ